MRAVAESSKATSFAVKVEPSGRGSSTSIGCTSPVTISMGQRPARVRWTRGRYSSCQRFASCS